MSCTVSFSSPCALLQICYMQYERGGPHAGLFLFTEQARMARPVRQVKSQKTEMVGSLEQSTMHIRCAHKPAMTLPDVALLSAQEVHAQMLTCRCCCSSEQVVVIVRVACCQCLTVRYMERLMILHRYQKQDC